MSRALASGISKSEYLLLRNVAAIELIINRELRPDELELYMRYRYLGVFLQASMPVPNKYKLRQLGRLTLKRRSSGKWR